MLQFRRWRFMSVQFRARYQAKHPERSAKSAGSLQAADSRSKKLKAETANFQIWEPIASLNSLACKNPCCDSLNLTLLLCSLHKSRPMLQTGIYSTTVTLILLGTKRAFFRAQRNHIEGAHRQAPGSFQGFSLTAPHKLICQQMSSSSASSSCPLMVVTLQQNWHPASHI